MPRHQKATASTAVANEAEIAPPGVSPSLWRQAHLNANYYAPFKVSNDAYQIRGSDLFVMSILENDSGNLGGDPLVTPRTAEAGLGLIHKHLVQYHHAVNLNEVRYE